MKSADSQTPVALTAPSVNRGTAFTRDERRDNTARANLVRAGFPRGNRSETSGVW
jgi:hypothetical protein